MQAFNYLFNIGGDFSVKMEGMSEAMGNFNASINATQNGIGKLTQTFATFNLASDIVGKINNVFSGITEAGSAAELQLMNLKTLFGGNAEAAEAMYERISEYGKVTPYDKAGLIEAQRTMMSFGIEGEKAFETLKQIGDIAMGDSGKMQSLALAFAQMSSTGKLTGQDLMQMVNAGFNPLQEISKQTGKSVADLKKDMEKGAISVGMVEAAFRSATSEGGLFHNAIAEASETTAGKMEIEKPSRNAGKNVWW
ncbi:MAG: tape measure protein [Paludibacteraceae bacterium]|nr:tape measure protein [Paludibacteraceae bacterium]